MTASAIQRPASLARTAHPPPSAARLATPAKVTAMPINNGKPFLTNGLSARAKTKGRTGNMQGLTIVRAPAR